MPAWIYSKRDPDFYDAVVSPFFLVFAEVSEGFLFNKAALLAIYGGVSTKDFASVLIFASDNETKELLSIWVLSRADLRS